MKPRSIGLLLILLALQLSIQAGAQSRSAGAAMERGTVAQNRTAPTRRADNRRGDREVDRRDDRRDRNSRDNRRDDRSDDRRDDRWERYWKFRVGMRLLSLPLRYSQVIIGPTIYYYSDGVYFVKQGSAYVVVGSPVGGRVRVLPYGFRGFHLGARRYFYVNATYYVYAPATLDYVVVATPSGADQVVQSMTPDPIVYPAQGQTQEEIDQDRYECHEWAMDEASFNPASPQQQTAEFENRYNRGLTACLSGRGYTVE